MKQEMEMEIRFRTRKFVLAVSIIALASALLVNANITDVIWQNVVMFVGGGYFFANVVQKVKT
jgi:hypothetical protein